MTNTLFDAHVPEDAWTGEPDQNALDMRRCPRCETTDTTYKNEGDDWLTCSVCGYEFVQGEPFEFEQDAKDSYAAHVEEMKLAYPPYAPKSWRKQDSSVRFAWREHVEKGRD